MKHIASVINNLFGPAPTVRLILEFILLLSIATVLTAIGLNFIFVFDSGFMLVAIFAGLIFFGNWVILRLFSLKAAITYFALITPLWYIIANLIIGGDFGQGASAITNSAFVFLFYRDQTRKRNWLVFYNFFLLTLSYGYVNIYGPLYKEFNMPFDETLGFLTCSIWLLIVMTFFIKENQKLIHDLEVQNNNLYRTQKELENFTYISSHDLKAPLTNINSFLSLIKRDWQNEKYDNIPKYFNLVEDSTTQMNSLVRDILELGSINNSLSEKSFELVDLNKVINQVQKVFSNHDSGVKFEVDPLPSFMANPNDIYHLFQNLVENGVKYNDKEQPLIRVKNLSDNSQVMVSFEDNGIGIEQEFHDDIFDFFKRLHNKTEYTGTGLGLGLCKKIVRSYGGTISVRSQPGNGSVFTIALPLLQKV